MLDILTESAEIAGKLVRENFKLGGKIEAWEKTSQRDIVTRIDKESQEIIRKHITESLVKTGLHKDNIGFIGEENLGQPGKHIFIIDPIDGTTNFACGLPFFCISIAHAYQGDIDAGVIYNPIDNVIYMSKTGQGAWMKKMGITKKLETFSTPARQSLASMHTNTPAVWEMARKINEKIRGIRDMGSIALELAMLSDGIFNLVYCSRCYIWDVAAAKVILKEAGADIYNNKGKPWEPDWKKWNEKLEIMACNKDDLNDWVKLIENLK